MVTAEFDGNFAEMKSKCGRSVEWWRQRQEAIQTREPNFYCSVVGFVKATLLLLTVKKKKKLLERLDFSSLHVVFPIEFI